MTRLKCDSTSMTFLIIFFSENFVCSLDDSGLTVTFDFYAKWYKFARLQAIDHVTFLGGGTEAAPAMVAMLETGATCGIDLPNPEASAATTADKFSVTITLATPECGFVVVCVTSRENLLLSLAKSKHLDKTAHSQSDNNLCGSLPV